MKFPAAAFLLPALAVAAPLSQLAPASSLSPPSSLALPALRAFPTTPCAIYGDAVVQCYEGAGMSFTAAATVHGGHFYQCSCAVQGEVVDGNP
ncbi:hypothetical protein MMC18_004125 [Xylographa bjoerkii]|nr:hypothetical protein [Xylographa bjoerkii]